MVKLECWVFLVCFLYTNNATIHKSMLVLIHNSQNMMNPYESVV